MPRTRRITPPEGLFTLGGDLPVRRMGFGAMRVTGEGIFGEPHDRHEAIAVLRLAVELGVDLIDTADAYGPEVSERLIAEALHPYRPGLVIATKGGLLRPGPGIWNRDCRPEHLRAAVEGSLKRLRLERIDLYQLHAVDPRVPLEDSVGALADLRRQGKIRHIGLSNVSLEELTLARTIAPIVSVQNRYSLADRISDPVVDACARAGMAFLPYFPLGNGALARRGGPLELTARRLGVPPSQIALAWLFARSPCVLPIPGTSRVAHLKENVKAVKLRLSEADFRALSDEGAPT
jgi:pyridoxine 4-dehydrogenase